MKKLPIAALLCAVLFAGSGCAPVKFYSNAELTRKTGLKYYSVKPYLLVEREAETNRITRSTVIYLPDLANPNYMVVSGGPGSKKAEMKLSDGYVSSFGLSTNAGLSESVASLADLISESSGALSDITTLRAISGATSTSLKMEIYEILISAEGTTVKKVEIE